LCLICCFVNCGVCLYIVLLISHNGAIGLDFCSLLKYRYFIFVLCVEVVIYSKLLLCLCIVPCRLGGEMWTCSSTHSGPQHLEKLNGLLHAFCFFYTPFNRRLIWSCSSKLGGKDKITYLYQELRHDLIPLSDI
jgi:hypothetical protein